MCQAQRRNTRNVTQRKAEKINRESGGKKEIANVPILKFAMADRVL